MLRDSLDSAGVRMTYLKGSLEITSPSRAHEVDKKQIARLFELFCLERALQKGTLEIRPGQANGLRFMSRWAPNFINGQLAKASKSLIPKPQ